MFVLPEKSPADLFILYPPGARGDFLAAVLKDSIDNRYKKYIVPAPYHYQKAHCIKSTLGCPIHQYKIKIRIKLSTADDYLTVAHLWQQKITSTDSWQDIIVQLINNEKEACLEFDQNFDHIVNFKSLFDIDFIKDLYQQINKRELSSNAVECIQHNISLQQWVTMSTTNLDTV